MEITEVLRRGIVTEKSVKLQERNQYTFKVALDANKIDIRRAVESLFNVHVIKVNVMRMPGKPHWSRNASTSGVMRPRSSAMSGRLPSSARTVSKKSTPGPSTQRPISAVGLPAGTSQ